MRVKIKKNWNQKNLLTQKVGKKYFVKMKSKKMILNLVYRVSLLSSLGDEV